MLKEPYPWNLHTLCTDSYAVREEEFVYVESFVEPDSMNVLPCTVVGRKKKGDEYFYTVELQTDEDDIHIIEGYPKGGNGVDLYNIAYSSMWHMKEAFRHKLFVPDDIFPKNWMTN